MNNNTKGDNHTRLGSAESSNGLFLRRIWDEIDQLRITVLYKDS